MASSTSRRYAAPLMFARAGDSLLFRRLGLTEAGHQAAILPFEIFVLRASQTARTSEVVSEHSSICKK
jgi:hypothetical protein